MSFRMNKVDQELRKRITEVIQQEIDDPDMDFLSITQVKTTTDLQETKVYYSLLDESKYEKAQKLLGKMKGLIRSSLAKRIHLKIIPELTFMPDDSIRYSVDIYKKLEDLKKIEDADET